MVWFGRKKEERATVYPNGSISVSADNFSQIFGGIIGGQSASGVNVTIDSALGVPAIFAAVNFMSGTMAGLPLNLYKRSNDGRERVKNGIATVLHDAVNDSVSSFEWRKYTFDQVFTGGRAFTYIERNGAGKVVNLWPLEPELMTIKKDGLIKTYHYKQSDKKPIIYEASEIIDVPFMLKSDGLTHRGPIMTNKDTIGLAIASTEYGSRFLQNGGVPPFIVTGGFTSGGAMARAADDIESAVKKAAKDSRQALVLPSGLDMKPIGVDPEKSQLIETQRFMIEQIARIYSLPPTFLQDLTNGTFSNTEQQDLHFVKHTIRRWIEQFEQELNLKMFGRNSNRLFAEFNLDGLLRGDFSTRMTGYATAVQNGIMKPNEARRKENMADDPNGDSLMIQGATVPIGNQLKLPLEGIADAT